ncbi:hypothetical protein NQZ68_022221 [Dissostichus eleginoides]|nr:hypothetical protein NQZ68_022221 [Dissostichus eleginoides]
MLFRKVSNIVFRGQLVICMLQMPGTMLTVDKDLSNLGHSQGRPTFPLVNDDEDDMESIAVKAIKQIIQDVKNIDMDKGHYNISINKDIIKESYSQNPEEGEEQTNPKINRIPKDSPDIPYDIDIHQMKPQRLSAP